MTDDGPPADQPVTVVPVSAWGLDLLVQGAACLALANALALAAGWGGLCTPSWTLDQGIVCSLALLSWFVWFWRIAVRPYELPAWRRILWGLLGSISLFVVATWLTLIIAGPLPFTGLLIEPLLSPYWPLAALTILLLAWALRRSASGRILRPLAMGAIGACAIVFVGFPRFALTGGITCSRRTIELQRIPDGHGALVVVHCQGRAFVGGGIRVDRETPVFPGALSWWRCEAGPWPGDRATLERKGNQVLLTIEDPAGGATRISLPGH
jgi:hypothetical protein